MGKLNLDRDQIEQSRKLADQIVAPILQQVNRHTTVSIERCVLRMLGVEGTLEEKPKKPAPQGHYPLVNEVMDKLGPDRIARGVGYYFGLASLHNPKLSASALARKIADGSLDVDSLADAPIEKIDAANQAFLQKAIGKLRINQERQAKRPAYFNGSRPLIYVIVATGNIHEDIIQAQAAAEMGADVIAVIRSTAQSLLDYVPEGETTEGFGGTFATQTNFRLMRQALDQTEKKLKRRIGLTNYSSGLCMPEIAIMGAFEGIDFLLNDAMYGILFRDINMKRNFIDQHFSRRMCSLSGITIQTGEDNYLTTADAHKYWFQVLASHFINHAFAKRAGLHDSAISLGHAHEVDPWVEDSLLLEWAQAQLVREVFPHCPIKYMPPTKHKTGDIFFSYLYDGMFNLASVVTGQSIHLLGMHTEAIFNPFVQDRFLSLKNANYVFRAAKGLRDELLFQPNGKIVRRARQVLEDSLRLLRRIKTRGLMQAIEEGSFAHVSRLQDGGKGLDGVFEKTRDYYTPLARYLTPKGRSEEGVPTRPETRRPLRGRTRPRDDEDFGPPPLKPRDLRHVIRQEEDMMSQTNIPTKSADEGVLLREEDLMEMRGDSVQEEREEYSDRGEGGGPRRQRSRRGGRGRSRSRGRSGRDGGRDGRDGRDSRPPRRTDGRQRDGYQGRPQRPQENRDGRDQRDGGEGRREGRDNQAPDSGPPILLPDRMPRDNGEGSDS